ncbi:hypothetical protein K1719_018457 [Acacia pycnantha]|nr:hypothetical protein K1719_018457 [Acacia pycnantha]
MERGYEGGGNFRFENAVVMTRDPKSRLRWTADRHNQFVDVVTKLGGPDRESVRGLRMKEKSTDVTTPTIKGASAFLNLPELATVLPLPASNSPKDVQAAAAKAAAIKGR